MSRQPMSVPKGQPLFFSSLYPPTIRDLAIDFWLGQDVIDLNDENKWTLLLKRIEQLPGRNRVLITKQPDLWKKSWIDHVDKQLPHVCQVELKSYFSDEIARDGPNICSQRLQQAKVLRQQKFGRIFLGNDIENSKNDRTNITALPGPMPNSRQDLAQMSSGIGTSQLTAPVENNLRTTNSLKANGLKRRIIDWFLPKETDNEQKQIKPRGQGWTSKSLQTIGSQIQHDPVFGSDSLTSQKRPFRVWRKSGNEEMRQDEPTENELSSRTIAVQAEDLGEASCATDDAMIEIVNFQQLPDFYNGKRKVAATKWQEQQESSQPKTDILYTSVLDLDDDENDEPVNHDEIERLLREDYKRRNWPIEEERRKKKLKIQALINEAMQREKDLVYAREKERLDKDLERSEENNGRRTEQNQITAMVFRLAASHTRQIDLARAVIQEYPKYYPELDSALTEVRVLRIMAHLKPLKKMERKFLLLESKYKLGRPMMESLQNCIWNVRNRESYSQM